MWYNTWIAWLLRSPLHRLLSGSMMLLTYQGRKSGRQIVTPISYLPTTGGQLLTISFRGRTWWRNLRGGAAVRLHLQGRSRPADGEVIEEPEQVLAQLRAYAQQHPDRARLLGLRLDAAGQPISGELQQAADKMVVVRFALRG